jgi:AraC-like DNA-binding protein
MFNREAEESSMTISAQVIDTIVEWIDDNLHQPLRIEEIARHAGYSKWHLQRLFMQYKGESLGRYIRERKLLLAARDLRESTSGCTISACATGLTRSRRLPAYLPAPSTSRRVRTVKRTIARHINMSRVGRVSVAATILWTGARKPGGAALTGSTKSLTSVIHRRRHRTANP